MAQFLGTHKTRLDNKGRTSVPASYRNELRNGNEAAPASLVLLRSFKHACIEGWPVEAFFAMTKPVDSLGLFGDDEEDLTTVLYANATPVEADRDGRIILPGTLVEHACLTDTAVFMGLGRYFQIWEPEAAERRIAEAAQRALARRLTVPAAAPAAKAAPTAATTPATPA